MNRRRRPAGPWQRLALVVLGVVLALALAEATLQVLRQVNLARLEHEPPTEADASHHVILCVGDSHTAGYGVIAPLESYPAQLERMLKRGDPEAPFVVDNLGVPGMNTLLILELLKQRCAVARPDVVVLLGGFNNSWSAMKKLGEPRFMLGRLWRLWRTPRPQSGPPRTERDGDNTTVIGPDGRRIPLNHPADAQGLRQGAALRASVARDLTAAVEFCRQHGIPLLLQTYASTQSDTFLVSSAAVRDVAGTTGTPLVDQAEWFARQGLDPTLTLQPDGHPTARGYTEMAAAVLARLRELPEFADWPFPDPDGPAAVFVPRGGSITVTRLPDRDDGTALFQVQGPPGRAWMLGLASAFQEVASGPALSPEDSTFRTCRGQPGLAGTLDDDGAAVAWLAPELRALLGEGPLFAQALLLDELAMRPEEMVSAASEVLPVE